MSQTIDKQQLLSVMQNTFTAHIRLGQSERASELSVWMDIVKKGTFDSDVDYQQRYEALVRAIRKGYMFSESADGLIHQIESTTDFRLREDNTDGMDS